MRLRKVVLGEEPEEDLVAQLAIEAAVTMT
jgi:hypothetical protein